VLINIHTHTNVNVDQHTYTHTNLSVDEVRRQRTGVAFSHLCRKPRHQGESAHESSSASSSASRKVSSRDAAWCRWQGTTTRHTGKGIRRCVIGRYRQVSAGRACTMRHPSWHHGPSSQLASPCVIRVGIMGRHVSSRRVSCVRCCEEGDEEKRGGTEVRAQKLRAQKLRAQKLW
jgi:hypothetical protein